MASMEDLFPPNEAVSKDLLRRHLPGPVVNVAGFGARGDGRSDDTAAVAAALAEAPGHGLVHFPPGDYLLASGGLQLPADRRVTLFGSGSRILCGGAGAAFTIDVGVHPEAPRHRIIGFDFHATAARRGVGLEIVDSNHIMVEGCRFYGLARGIVFEVRRYWCEGHTLFNCEFRGCERALSYDKRSDRAMVSFASQHLHNVIVATNTGAGGETGLHVGAACSLYRSNFNNLAIFPQTPNATGLYCDGVLRNVSGLLSIEGPATPVAGVTGLHFGPQATDTQTDLHLDIRGQFTHRLRFDSARTPIVGMTTHNVFENGHLVRGGRHNILRQVVNADDFATVHWREVSRADGQPQFEGRPALWPHFVDIEHNDDLLPLSALFVLGRRGQGGRLAVDGGAVPDVAGVNALYLANPSPTAVNDFSGGHAGQLLLVCHRNGNSRVVHSQRLRLQGSRDYPGAADAMQIFWKDGASGPWREISRVEP